VFVDVRRNEGQVLLYVEQLQRLFGADEEPYPVYMQDLLKPALACGDLRILGACSVEAYRQYIERDAAMQRRFQEICSPELMRHLGHDRM
jgi:ATP-dependent Clp protease ATP-binding subunit ClpB